jgi:23S rRNA pseudouridine1911/1915/1917 synthase
LHSGRTHQIRVQPASSSGNPLLRDKVYAPKFADAAPRQMLHAWRLGFTHPGNGEWRDFEAPLPADFKQVLATLP